MKSLEYRKCNTTGKLLHYTEFVKAGFGWLAIDGSRRHSQSKIGKRVNQCLSNGLRTHVNGKLISIGHKLHPNYSIWIKIISLHIIFCLAVWTEGLLLELRLRE